MKQEWALEIIELCKAVDIPVFMKQMGSRWARKEKVTHIKGGDIEEWPLEYQVREFPRAWLNPYKIEDGIK